MTPTSARTIVPGKFEDEEAFLSDHQLFLLGKTIHRIARFEQLIADWTRSLIIASGETPPLGSDLGVISSLRQALKSAPDEHKQFDTERFLTTAQEHLNLRHFLAHGIAVRDKEGDLCLRKTRPTGKIKADSSKIRSETLVIDDEAFEKMLANTTELDMFVAQQRQLFKPVHERPDALIPHPLDGRIMLLKSHGQVKVHSDNNSSSPS